MKDLTPIQVRSLMQSLIDNAEPFVYKLFTENNYNNDFNIDGVINTPIGEAQLNFEQIKKLYAKERVGYYGLIKLTLTNPLLILPSWDKNNVKAITFIKTFIDKKKQKIYFASITRDENGLLSVVSNYRKKEEQIKKILVKGYKYKSYQKDSVTSLRESLGLTKAPKPLLVFVHIGVPFTITNVKQKKQSAKTPKIIKSGTDLFPELGCNKCEDVGLSFIQRFVDFNNKTINNKQIEVFISDLSKAIKAKQITKTHPYKNQINAISNRLHNIYKTIDVNEFLNIKISKIEELNEILKKENSGLGFLPTVIAAAAGKMVEHFTHKHLSGTKKEFENKKPLWFRSPLPDNSLNGLGKDFIQLLGINSIPTKLRAIPKKVLKNSIKIQKKITPQKQNLSGIMTVTEAINGKYDLIGLDGDYLKLIGEACKPTSFFIYGPGGSGKSTFTLKFANYMAQKGNKILYVAGEQYNTPVFSKMLQRLKIIDTPNFVIVKNLDTVSPKDFDFIAIDSKDSLNFEINDFKELQKKYPNLSFVILSQGTKVGGFTGSEKWRNMADTMIYCENLIAYTNKDKNRWGGKTQINILKLK